MTAPDTNLKKQQRRHRGPLIGMAVAVGVAAILLLWLLARTMGGSTDQSVEENTPPSAETTTGIPAEGSATGPSNTGTPETVQDSPAPAD